ncbi:hypothetical protein O6P43_023862 [Quillaja saponaria]|uniref:Uncharacterized protein n=1 Tax=Quillaja saponaria TaxID=32244 RepID=A0AAD7LGB7_QUISA|nr:hypothetical protein O6P43_023862 [Quillaja saponaria]
MEHVGRQKEKDSNGGKGRKGKSNSRDVLTSFESELAKVELAVDGRDKFEEIDQPSKTLQRQLLKNIVRKKHMGLILLGNMKIWMRKRWSSDSKVEGGTEGVLDAVQSRCWAPSYVLLCNSKIHLVG